MYENRGLGAQASADQGKCGTNSINTRVGRMQDQMNRLISLNDGLYKCLTRLNGGRHRSPTVPPSNVSKLSGAKESPSYSERLDDFCATFDEQLARFSTELDALASELE